MNVFSFFFNDTATTEIYTLSLHDALPISREPNEVHAAAHLAPPAARVRDAHYQPERDRQVQRRKRLGVAARGEWIAVGEYTRRDECDGQAAEDPKRTRLNSSHANISYAVF